MLGLMAAKTNVGTVAANGTGWGLPGSRALQALHVEGNFVAIIAIISQPCHPLVYPSLSAICHLSQLRLLALAGECIVAEQIRFILRAANMSV